MKKTRVPTSRAKPISWVTTTIVIFDVGKLLHDVENLADHFGVEGGGRLVEEHDAGVHCKSADDGDTLLLTAGKLAGVSIRLIGKTDAGKQLEGVFLGLFLALEFKLCRSEPDVFQNREVREEVEVLEHHAHMRAHLIEVDAGGGYVLSVDYDLTGMRRDFKHIQAAQKGAFSSSPGGADDDYLLAVFDFTVDSVKDRFVRDEALFEILNLYHFLQALLSNFLNRKFRPQTSMRYTSAIEM